MEPFELFFVIYFLSLKPHHTIFKMESILKYFIYGGSEEAM